MSLHLVMAVIMVVFVTTQAMQRPDRDEQMRTRKRSEVAMTNAEKQKMKVVYGVVGTTQQGQYAEELRAVEETWAKDVPPQKLVVAGASGNAPGVTYKPAPLCQDLYTKLQPGHACREAFLIAMGYDLGADWVVVAHPDNYIFPRRYEEALKKYDSTKPQILGSFGCGAGYCEDHKPGLCGGGTYAVSRAAMERMMGARQTQTFIEEVTHASFVVGNWSDLAISCVARRFHVAQVIPTFIGGLHGNGLGDDETLKQTSSSQTLTFHDIKPTMMHKIHKMEKTSVEAGNETWNHLPNHGVGSDRKLLRKRAEPSAIGNHGETIQF